MASRTASSILPDSLQTQFRQTANHPLLDRTGELELGRQLQAAAREIARLAVEVPLTARLILEEWRLHRAEGRGPGRFGGAPGEPVERLDRAMERVRTALEAVDEAKREADREPARRRLARNLRAAALPFEVLEPVAREVHRRASELEAIGRRGDRAGSRRLARELGIVPAKARRQRNALEAALDRRKSARDAFVLHNLRLVGHQATRFGNRGVAYADLVQEGVLGVMRAAEKFEPERGHRFTTYAIWWIQQAMNRAVQKQARTVRLPSHAFERLSRVLRLQTEIRAREGREAGSEELARLADLAGPATEALLEQGLPTLSIDHGRRPEDRPLLESLGEQSDPTDASDRLRVAREIEAALARLPHPDAEILRIRFGLQQDAPKTLQEVGRSRGLSRERVRQIEKRALGRLRKILLDRRFQWEASD